MSKPKTTHAMLRLMIGVMFCWMGVFPCTADNSVVIWHGESSVEQYAALELQEYLFKLQQTPASTQDLRLWREGYTNPSSGQIVPASPEQKAPQAFLDSLRAPSFVLVALESNAWLQPALVDKCSPIRPQSDGFVIETINNGDCVVIAAHTTRGVLYGVYSYLRKVCGIGFFEDGERIPANPPGVTVPPFPTDQQPNWHDSPKFDYRSQWIWTRYYGADRGHPLNWGYQQWVSHLRWLAQAGFNSVMLYPVGYTRLWGDVHRRAFPESIPFEKEIKAEIDPYWGANKSIMAGWGRAPEQTTRLMQQIMAYGREKLGLQFEYNFYLGNFEESLQLAYPQGTWIDWTNLPHHAYFGAAGRSPILVFTDPLSKELNQRFWKTYIETFGTDHRYWIAYREESAPNPHNPEDPDGGKSLADAVNTQREWILELDPEAEFFHWDWHGNDLWLQPDDLASMVREELVGDALVEKLREGMQAYFGALEPDISIVNVLPSGVPSSVLAENPERPWVIGSLLGYAGQDLGWGGLYIPVQAFFDAWQSGLDQNQSNQGQLRGILHWNEIVQVSPLLDQLVARVAWTATTPRGLDDQGVADPLLDEYFAERFGVADASAVRKAVTRIYRQYPKMIPVGTMRIPHHHGLEGFGEEHQQALLQYRQGLSELIALLPGQQDNPLFQRTLLDLGRMVLHTSSKYYLQAAVVHAVSEGLNSQQQFDICCQASQDALDSLAELLATDQRHCLGDAVLRMVREPGANPLLQQVMLEHASGILFGGYALNDTAEFVEHVSCPLLKRYLSNLAQTFSDPVTYPVTTAQQLMDDQQLLQEAFLNLPLSRFEDRHSGKQPVDVLKGWLEREKQRQHNWE